MARAEFGNQIERQTQNLAFVFPVSFACALLNGAGNFVWAFNWTRVGASNQTNSQVQEAGGLASAALSWVVAGIVRFYLYLYSEPVKCHAIQNVAVSPIQDEPEIVIDL